MKYNRLKELFEKGDELATEIIELKAQDFDHRCSLQSNTDNDVFITNFHNSRLTEINSKLLKQLEEVKTQINEL